MGTHGSMRPRCAYYMSVLRTNTTESPTINTGVSPYYWSAPAGYDKFSQHLAS